MCTQVSAGTINMIRKEFVALVLELTTFGCAPGAPEKGKLQVTQTSHRYVILEAGRQMGSVKRSKLIFVWENIWDITTYYNLLDI